MTPDEIRRRVRMLRLVSIDFEPGTENRLRENWAADLESACARLESLELFIRAALMRLEHAPSCMPVIAAREELYRALTPATESTKEGDRDE